MPELPEIEALVRRLGPRLVGTTILDMQVHRPVVLRNLLAQNEDESVLVGRPVTDFSRLGKHLVMEMDGLWLVTHFMLAGNLVWLVGDKAPGSRDYYTITLSDGTRMRYNDTRGMGKTYLTRDLAKVPGLVGMAPDALSDELTTDVFLKRIRSSPGEIKGVLTRERVASGIGNAYADEILYDAGIYPFLKSGRLSDAQRRTLYNSMRNVLIRRVDYLMEHWPPEMDLHWREGLMVHRKAGEPCPRCGTPISEINVARRPTNFCRSCQPGLLIRN